MVNQILLTLEALPRAVAAGTRVVLMSPQRPDASTKTNAGLLAEFFDAKRIFELPWLGDRPTGERVLREARVAAHAPGAGEMKTGAAQGGGGALVARNDSRQGW